MPPPGKKAECLILNGAECEPYLTSDYRIMLERSREIVVGAAIMKHVLGGCRTVIGIEENKPEAIRVMSEAVAELQKSAKGYEGISVMSLKKNIRREERNSSSTQSWGVRSSPWGFL